MYNHPIHSNLNQQLQKSSLDLLGVDNSFYLRAIANGETIHQLYNEIYGAHPNAAEVFNQIVAELVSAHRQRSASMRAKDEHKAEQGHWFLSNQINGMSLYVDRFCGQLLNLPEKLSYFNELGVNLLHLMPIFESPEGESDGGYAVSNFRKVDSRFGSLDDLIDLRKAMDEKGMMLMVDIVLNHTSHKHEWAEKAKSGDKHYQQYYYMYDDRSTPDAFEKNMPEIFPESSPGNFTFNKESGKWVMTVFHHYQWDLH
ncbi:MAG TPA: alpha-amylase, partial [Cytophagales bacterium]|nr:alpha-amylase [Cytophagales bacterium]